MVRELSRVIVAACPKNILNSIGAPKLAERALPLERMGREHELHAATAYVPAFVREVSELLREMGEPIAVKP